MKAIWAMAAVGLTLMGSVGTGWAQPYGGSDYGYRDRDYGSRDRDYGGRDRDYGYRDRDEGYRDRGPRSRGDSAFNEREYLRCNPDVRRAVERGKMESGLLHWQVHGQREGRRLRC
ncbi:MULTISPECIES: hypothetical protein [Methylobacterium]|uniref:hypothetical protein n=1 Tax=Methylobacterium TaxID=407 RepID=UPI0010428875|nr:MULTISPECIES: hypothetical protein [Methylobacterium]MDR7039401.1 hypothetical protein [Methylobacterium sp. BE186]